MTQAHGEAWRWSGAWLPRNSVVSKYFVALFLTAMVPLIGVGVLYDRYAQALLDQITGERLSAQLAATASRINAFFEARLYQLETLSNYPPLPAFLAPGAPGLESELGAILRIEADTPDLYGILFFAPDGSLARVVPGQAAFGPPYWSGRPFPMEGIPVTMLAGAEMIGPVPPDAGQSGWFLLRQQLRDQRNGLSAGSIALHARLSSVTELLGAPSVAGILQPVLQTPAGYFNAVGHPVVPRGQIVEGPEVLPGWRPSLVVDPAELLRPFLQARRGVYAAMAASALVIVALSLRLARRLRRRFDALARGAEAVAAGNLDHRIAASGSDELGALSRAFNSMAAKLQQSIAQTVRMERLVVLGEFATTVAHEVRNPLATMKTSVQALARQERDGERLELLADMEQEIDRLARVMEDMLSFGRPRPPEPVRVPVRELLRRLQSLIGPQAARQEIGLSVQGDSDIVFLADPDHLMQILVNLLMNALQASKPLDLVSVRAFRRGLRAAIEIRDTGCGIPDAALPRVMDPFFTTKPKGSGLGLSISRQLAELNGGDIEILTAEGRGTTVRVTLPTEAAP